MKNLLFILCLMSFSALADYEVEVRTDFTCSVNPKGISHPTERFDNEPDSITRTIELVDETQDYVTQRCYHTNRYNYVEPTPAPVPDPTPSGILRTDIVRAPVTAPITAWCADGSVETQPAAASMTLCGESFWPIITKGQIIYASPPNIPIADSSDVIVLSVGTYTSTVNCGGRSAGWCGDGNSGVQIIGDISGPKPIIEGAYNCGASVSGVSDITLANVEATVTCDRRGTKTNTRFVNLYCHDKASRSSGACGNWSDTVKLRVFDFKTERTGVLGENNAHSLYHGGRGQSSDVEFGWLDMSDHVGGRCFQVYGHHADESMADIYVHDSVATNCQGNAAFLISHTDGQSGTPDERSWIDSVRFERNVCNGNKAQFRGRNLNGGQDWTADSNDCPIDSTMGGDSSGWIDVTNNTELVTGNTR